MAHHKSALKRIGQDERRRLRNRLVKGTARTCVKMTRQAVDSSNAEEAQTQLKVAISKLNRAVSKGAIPKRRGSRLVSRLTKAVNRTA